MSDEKSGRDEATSDADAGRKPYAAPTLRVYGDIHELTRSHSSIGRKDGGGGAKRKTG